MRRDLGVLPAVFPMPVLMIGTYDGNGKVNVMNMAWGNISTGEKIFNACNTVFMFLLEEREVAEGSIITGRIVNVNVDEKILNEKASS